MTKPWRTEEQKIKQRETQNRILRDAREDALWHYSGETGHCTWPGCYEDDPEMLTLDHIEPILRNRAQKGHVVGGAQLCRTLQRGGWPDGYRTLCFNHNMKAWHEWRRSNPKEPSLDT